MTDPARFVREAITDYDARALVDAWDRLDTVNRERDALVAELAAARPAPEPSSPPTPEPNTEPTPEPFDPVATADAITRRRG